MLWRVSSGLEDIVEDRRRDDAREVEVDGGEVEEVGRSGLMLSNGLLWQIRSAQITDHGSAMLK